MLHEKKDLYPRGQVLLNVLNEFGKRDMSGLPSIYRFLQRVFFFVIQDHECYI